MPEVGQVVGKELLHLAGFAGEAVVAALEGRGVGVKIGGLLPLGEGA